MSKHLIGCQGYPWAVYFRQRGSTLSQNIEQALAGTKAAGCDCYEDGVGSADELLRLKKACDRHGLAMPSVYVNSRLHEGDFQASIDQVLTIARSAREVGVRFIVTNPEPVRWGSAHDKSDTQLRTQAMALRKLTLVLRDLGIELAYHWHDPELRQAAREVHHMLLATRDIDMKVCLDTHWTYRGAGNSQLAMEDVLTLYGPRVVMLHLRQSHNGIWSETFGPGDIDHTPLFQWLAKTQLPGPIILEQCAEKGTPATLPMDAALARSTAWIKEQLR